MLMLLLAALCVLTACGTPTEKAPAPEQVLTIALWDYDKISYDRRLVEAFEETHPGVRVQVISYPDAYYDQKMESLLIGGRQVDVFFIRSLSSLRRLVEYDAAWPLDAMIEEYGLDLADSPDLDYMRMGGQLYGVPYRHDRYVLVYNCDLFDRAGIDYPGPDVTWEQMREIARQLQPALHEDEYALMVLPMDIQWIASGRTAPVEAGSAENLRPIMELLLGMQQEGTAPAYGDCIAQDIQQQCFELGKYGMYVGGTWYLNYLMTDEQAGRFDFRWGVTTAPRWEQSDGSAATAVLSGIGIGQQSENRELAWEFIRFAAGAEGAKIMAEEQMMPAYMDERIQEIYRENFTGDVLDPAVYQSRPTRYGSRTQTAASQQVQCDAFRQCMIGEKTVDEA
ncbi:MAG: ABC transporter substrate-binding protein, partial [Butyricicoccus sp.]